MAKTLIDIDDELLAEAKDILGAGTKAATVRQALERVVAEHRFGRWLDDVAARDDEQRAVVERVRDAGW
jgi:Arc/MetJ family transcription regulator